MHRRPRAWSAALLLLTCASLAAQQADVDRTEALSRRAADRLRALHDEADRLASQERSLLGDLRKLELERQIRVEEVRQVEREAATVGEALAALDTQVDGLEAQGARDTPRLKARIVSLYKLGQGRYLKLLFSTADVRQLAQAARTVTALAAQDQAQVDAHARRLADLQASRRSLEQQRAQLAALRGTALRAREAADMAMASRNALIADIDQRRDLNAQLAGELQGAQQRLQDTLAGLAAGTAPPPAALPLSPFRGDLDWPAVGPVRQGFGSAARVGTATNGIDIAAGEGQPVHAIHEGRVLFAGPFAGFGRLVIVDHGAQAFSLYGNLGDAVVTQGQAVSRGAELGTVGVAASGAAGLYFELRIDARPVDPLQWLRKP